jgi:hypothetical protein
MQPCVVHGPARKKIEPNSVVDKAIVEKAYRQLAEGVNVVVNEPTDILALCYVENW